MSLPRIEPDEPSSVAAPALPHLIVADDLEQQLAIRPNRLEPGTRPEVWGKFLFADGGKFYIKGITYGPFRPRADGCEYHDPAAVRTDFEQILALGCNAVRTYTVPPVWLLDIAAELGLRVMVGLPWEQHVTFLDSAERRREIERKVRAAVRPLREHPAVLCYAIGNEIPGEIVRWYGRRRIEAFLRRLYDAVKQEDPTALATYVNYPTTEYLNTPGDFFCFNLYLESGEQMQRYVARLHNLSGNKPVVLAEIGLDSMRNGEEQQAASLDTQIRAAFASGCAGVVTFAWTDEWYRGGADIEDWGFGLTDRLHRPKLAWQTVAAAYADGPFGAIEHWPRISVVVCSFNGSRTLERCCQELMHLDYADYEVIVVDDGSTDRVSEIAGRYRVRLIRTENRGLSSARNTGADAATGEIVAYLDDDAWPDVHWLRYIAMSFASGRFAGIGGPNLPPPSDGGVADCVANAPGGPIHVLLSDDEAEHIPGCNMAFRRSALGEVGGCDPAFRIAGDDVDLCWRIQEKTGGKLGFTPAAVVWHHRRGSMSGYLKQQWAYGKAEAILERKWPEKYNVAGHLSWRGRIYADHLVQLLEPRSQRIYHGTWGIAAYQSVYQFGAGRLATLVTLPEWYLFIAGFGGLALLGLLWRPLLVGALPLFAVALGASVAQAITGASRAEFPTPLDSRWRRLKRYVLTAALHFLQPIARLLGRFHWGLTPWRHRASGLAFPGNTVLTRWSERWQERRLWLEQLEASLIESRAVIQRGGDFDSWDFRLRYGFFQETTVTTALEEHGQGRQLVRARLESRLTPPAGLSIFGSSVLALLALQGGSVIASATLLALAFGIAIQAMREISTSKRAMEVGLLAAGPRS